ncbi:MAG: hypothetical protein MHM6MM_008532, partial [Cercozoa sp. M6MM]
MEPSFHALVPLPVSRLTIVLYLLPLILQFAMCTLIVVFMSYVAYSRRREWQKHRNRVLWFACLLCAVVVVNVAVYASLALYDKTGKAVPIVFHLVLASAYLLLCAGYFVYARTLSNLSLDVRLDILRTMKAGASTTPAIMLVFGAIYVTRALFNLSTAAGFLAVTLRNLDQQIKPTALPAMFVFVWWELLPTALVLWYFRYIPNSTSRVRNNFCTALRAWLCCCWPRSDQRSALLIQATPGSRVFPHHLMHSPEENDARLPEDALASSHSDDEENAPLDVYADDDTQHYYKRYTSSVGMHGKADESQLRFDGRSLSESAGSDATSGDDYSESVGRRSEDVLSGAPIDFNSLRSFDYGAYGGNDDSDGFSRSILFVVG